MTSRNFGLTSSSNLTRRQLSSCPQRFIHHSPISEETNRTVRARIKQAQHGHQRSDRLLFVLLHSSDSVDADLQLLD